MNPIIEILDNALTEPCLCGTIEGETNCPYCDGIQEVRNKINLLTRSDQLVRYTVHNYKGEYLTGPLGTPVLRFTDKPEAAVLFSYRATADNYAQRVPGGYVDSWKGCLEPLL